MRITIEFDEPPAVEDFVAILTGVTKAYRWAAVVEPTSDLKITIDTGAGRPAAS